MKKNFILLIFLFSLFGCADKKATESGPALKDSTNLKRIVGIAKVEPELEMIELASEVSGVVQKVYKKENDSVKVGDLILELKHEVDDANVAQIKSQLNTQLAQVAADQSSISETRVRYENAKTTLDRLKRLQQRGAETQQNVDNADADLKAYVSNISRLQALVNVSEKRLSETKAQLLVSQKQLDQKFVRAPVNGLILSLDPTPGSSIDSKKSFGQLSPQCRTIAVGEIDELFADKVTVGQKAWIRNPGFSDTLTIGTLYFAASYLKKKSLFTDQAGEKEDRRVREVKILLDHPEKLLLNARVECVLILPDSSN